MASECFWAWIYVGVAALVSFFQGWRGWFFQWKVANFPHKRQQEFAAKQAEKQATEPGPATEPTKKKDAKEEPPPAPGPLEAPNITPFEIKMSRCLADAVLYFVSSVAGFLSLFLAYRVLQDSTQWDGVQTGTMAALVFFALLGLLGVTGQLPHLLQLGKLLPGK